jgi:hypothetical protein
MGIFPLELRMGPCSWYISICSRSLMLLFLITERLWNIRLEDLLFDYYIPAFGNMIVDWMYRMPGQKKRINHTSSKKLTRGITLDVHLFYLPPHYALTALRKKIAKLGNGLRGHSFPANRDYRPSRYDLATQRGRVVMRDETGDLPI